nr:MAG TPA: hypothetical protein [Bacteriophage sp.]
MSSSYASLSRIYSISTTDGSIARNVLGRTCRRAAG